MRVVLIGSPSERARLRRELHGSVVEIAGEAETVAEAHTVAPDAETYLVARTRLIQRDFDRVTDGEDGPEGESLTPREIEVLALLAEGLPNKAIARRLDISDQTVKFHVAAIYGKLGAVNRTDAVRRAVRRGLVVL